MSVTTVENPRRTAAHALVLVACVGVLVVQLRDVSFTRMFVDVRPLWLLAAVAGFVVSLAAAAHNISAFAPLRLRAVDTLRAQLAIGGLRVIAPAAVSTPAIGTRFLVRSGLETPTALTVVAVAQIVQLVATVAVVGAIAGFAAGDVDLPGRSGLLVALAGAVVLAVAVVVARHVPRARAVLVRTVASARTVGAHLRAHPVRAVTGLGASAALTLTHVAAFACCVMAVGGHASLLTLTAVYLAASSAGSLVPTPGGIGAVETAMISGLVAAGLGPDAATAAALLSRLVTVWLPAVPGLVALRGLRRDGLL
ncbi:lysylphosphatidylglycerol synthase transmembrane domain-containing protein [Jatrophihabitans fulvus]